MRHEPLANRVIMKPITESKQTRGGIIIPDIATRHKGVAFGEVIAVGEGRRSAEGKLIPCCVKIGQIVMFPRQAPAVLPLLADDGTETVVLMCPDADIISIVHDLPRATGLLDINGADLAIVPQSMALPDSVYENRDGLDRVISDMRQRKAPPDVIAELEAENRDEDEGSFDHIEQG